MAKVTLTDLTSLANDTSAVNSLNTNFQTLEDYINNNVLSRDTGAETNTMQNDIDMNSYSLNNVNNLAATTMTLNGVSVSTTTYTPDLTQVQTWAAPQIPNTQTVTTSGSVTLDFDTYNNFIITLDGNITLANPSTGSVGQGGFICFIQDGTGSRTLTLGTEYLTSAAGDPTLTTTAGAIDLIGYVIISETQILLGDALLEFS